MDKEKLKYSEELEGLYEICPPENYQSKNITAFRWVYDDINDDENFKPLAKRNPQRLLSLEDKMKCKSYSLSMFNSKDTAVKRFEFFKRKLKKKANKLGTNIAEGNILEEHGVNSEIEGNGHFSHFMHNNSNYASIFNIIDKL